MRMVGLICMCTAYPLGSIVLQAPDIKAQWTSKRSGILVRRTLFRICRLGDGAVSPSCVGPHADVAMLTVWVHPQGRMIASHWLPEQSISSAKWLILVAWSTTFPAMRAHFNEGLFCSMWCECV